MRRSYKSYIYRPPLRKKEITVSCEIEIKDFGAISSGKIILRPLTIFIGPNNSGKSYAAMLIHSIFEAHSNALYIRAFPGAFLRRFLSDSEEIRDFIDQLFDSKEEQILIPQQFVDKIIETVGKVLEKSLSDEITRSFACPINELVRTGKNTFLLKINHDSKKCPFVLENELRLIEPELGDIKIALRKIEKSASPIRLKRQKDGFLIEIGMKDLEFKKPVMEEIVGDVFSQVIVRASIEDMALPCYYLPAARSGILQGHKALAASIVKKAPYVGLERFEIPKLSGVVSDFISSILTLPDKKGKLYKLAESFEEELIEGEITVQELGDYFYPEIRYSFGNTEIPLSRSSSTVSELAPLILYLKYLVEPGSILIIEEPEAHLHPQNQRLLAKFLVKLIRSGVYLVITTHSDYLIEQLNTFILLSKVTSESRKKRYNYDEQDYINPTEISVYVFAPDEEGGHLITPIEINEESGISQEEFLKIEEMLYDETIKLRKELSREQK